MAVPGLATDGPVEGDQASSGRRQVPSVASGPEPLTKKA